MRSPTSPAALCGVLALVTGVATCQWVGARRWSPKEVAAESERLDRFLEEVFFARADRSPEWQAERGVDRHPEEWDDRSERRAREDLEMAERDLARLHAEFDPRRLSDDALLSYRIFERETARLIEAHRWRHHEYALSPFHGRHIDVPTLLVDVHRIETLERAEAWIARVAGVPEVFEQLTEHLAQSEELGVRLPRFVFPEVIEQCRAVVRGEPFEESASRSALLAAFNAGLETLDVDSRVRERLERDARASLRQNLGPAYERLIEALEAQAARAVEDSGVGMLPEGPAYYAFVLERATTIDLDAEELHSLARTEVERLGRAMQSALAALGMQGELRRSFDGLRSSPRRFLPNTAAGREAYLASFRAALERIAPRLDALVSRPPAGELAVLAVPAHRESLAPRVAYRSSDADGTRPAACLVNVFDLGELPVFEVATLAHRTGLPGRHLQASIARELELPRYRALAHHPAFVEGWALYATSLASALGTEVEGLAELGRLSLEIESAALAVVDTGVHHRRWTRDDAVDYLLENTPYPRGRCVRNVERVLVQPGRAVAATLGRGTLENLAAEARRRLGARFDLVRFHDRVLGAGPLPLALLEERIREWTGEIAPAAGGGPP